VATTIIGPRVGVADDSKIWVDRWGAPTKIVDPIGATTTLVRGDAAVPLRVTQVTRPRPSGTGAGWITKMTYNPRGNLTQIRDSTSHLGVDSVPRKVTRYIYNDANTPDSPTQVLDSIGNAARTTTYTYTPQGLTNDVVDTRSHRTVFAYTSDNLVKQVTEMQVETWNEGVANDTLGPKENQVWTFDYDAKRNLKADTAATGVVRSYVRDGVGRVTEVHDPLGTRVRRVYDPMDRDTLILQYTSAQPNPYGIDPLAPSRCDATQVLCSDPTAPFTPALPATLNTRKVFSALTLDTVADPRNVRRDYRYDARSMMTRERDDYGIAMLSFRGKSGLLDSTRFRTGFVTWNTYDAAGRRLVQFFPSIGYDGHGTVPGDSIRYGYNNLGNMLTAVSFNRGSITRTYYGNGMLKSKTSVTGGFTDVISYQYDQTWQVQRVVHNLDTTFYTYHPTKGELQTVTVRLGIGGPTLARQRIFSFEWDGLGRLKQITYPATSSGSMTVNYRYDAAGILRRVKSSNPVPGNDIFDLTLRNKSVDAVGRILSQDLLCPVGTAPSVLGNPCGTVNHQSSQVITTNAYNRMGWLAEQNRNGWIDRMRYDTSGNIIRKEDGEQGQVHHHTIEPGNPRHNRITRDSVQGHATLVMSYDANGSRLHELGGINDSREKHYYYDALGRMSGTFAYKGFERRDRPNDCHYDVDGQLASACDGAPWLAFDGDNVSGTLFAEDEGWSFFHGLGLDSPLMGYFRPTGGVDTRILYWVTDGAGRELAVADSAGQRESEDHTGDRASWRQAGGIANSYGFSADRQDNAVATNLSFFRNRVYDQNTGRWLQEDPMGVAGGLNLYQFSGNNPVLYTDPFGLKECHERGNCTQSDTFTPDPATKFQSLAGAAGTPGFGVALPAALAPAGQLVKPLADATTVGFEVNAGPVTAAFGADATDVSISPGIGGLNAMVSLTFAAPSQSNVGGSIGGVAGAGLVGGGSVELGSGGMLGVRGASVRFGVGYQPPTGLGKLFQRLAIIAVTFTQP
jgi:RHS repeat-associated protein